MAESARVDERPGDAWSALSRGSWTEAQDAFERELAAGESAHALEGLSWAAWWLDDAQTVFDARERAYRLYKKHGDHAGAARMATWLAADHLDFHGALAVARGWLRRAGRLLEGAAPGPEHGWLAFHEGYVAGICGDTTAAEELGGRAAEIGRNFDVPDLEMLGLALQGANLVASAEVERGMLCLDEATAAAVAGEATIPISGAWACCFLVTACSAVLDYDRAFQWCDRIADFAERYGSRYMLAFCRAEYGSVHLWRGTWSEAEALLEDAIDDFSVSRPAWSLAPIVTLAELRRRQGRADEALRLLDGAGASPAAQLCRARMALDLGETRRALDLAGRALRQVPKERRLDRAGALEVLTAACAARGETDEAVAALAELREIERLVGTGALRATTDLVEAGLAASMGEHERACRLFEDAVDGFERCGAPFDASRARLGLAESLAARGRREDAAREAVAARDRLADLGASGEAGRAQGLLDALGGGASESDLLTRREREVLEQLARGLTNRQIAERLVVSEHTVHRHVTNILRKLELPSRTAAAVYATRGK